MFRRTLGDIVYAFRLMASRPGFTIVVILTLAVGIGATTAMFGTINATLLSRLPYDEPDRVMTLWEANEQLDIPQDRVSAGTYRDWAEREAAKRAWLAEHGMYSEADEHSSCGVGLVVLLDGQPRRQVDGDLERRSGHRPARRERAVLRGPVEDRHADRGGRQRRAHRRHALGRLAPRVDQFDDDRHAAPGRVGLDRVDCGGLPPQEIRRLAQGDVLEIDDREDQAVELRLQQDPQSLLLQPVKETSLIPGLTLTVKEIPMTGSIP